MGIYTQPAVIETSSYAVYRSHILKHAGLTDYHSLPEKLLWKNFTPFAIAIPTLF